MRYLLRPVRDAEVEMVYRWRNEPRVRAVMPFSGAIDFEVHRRWWPQATTDPHRRMLILETGGLPVAIVVFADLVRGVSARWGLYTAPLSEISRGRSLAAWIASDFMGMRYGFEVLKVETLICDILHTHTAALRLRECTGAVRVSSRPLMPNGPPFVEMQFTRAQYESGGWPHPFKDRSAPIIPDPRDT